MSAMSPLYPRLRTHQCTATKCRNGLIAEVEGPAALSLVLPSIAATSAWSGFRLDEMIGKAAAAECTSESQRALKPNSPARKTVFKFELLSDFAMSEMRFRNDQDEHGRSLAAQQDIRQTSSPPQKSAPFTLLRWMYEKVTSVTVRNRTWR
jgi:hypothetical protein